MKATYSIAYPDSVETTLSVTMTVKEWRSLREQLNSSLWPSWKFGAAISAMIEKANREFGEQQSRDA